MCVNKKATAHSLPLKGHSLAREDLKSSYDNLIIPRSQNRTRCDLTLLSPRRACTHSCPSPPLASVPWAPRQLLPGPLWKRWLWVGPCVGRRGFNLPWNEKLFSPVPASRALFSTPCLFLSDPPDGRSMKSPLEGTVGPWTDLVLTCLISCSRLALGEAARGSAGRRGV